MKFKAQHMKTLLIVGALVALYFISAPFSFPRGIVLSIPEGYTITETARLLEEKKIIRSSVLFSVLATYLGGERGVSSGSYSFNRPLSLVHVFLRIRNGESGLPLVKVTIPEGSTSYEIARILDAALEPFNETAFLIAAQKYEGYLFPDTYFFTNGADPTTVLETMRAEFDKKILTLQAEFDAFGRPLSEVVIMASLLEKEARRFETRQIIAGILWKRLNEGMRLQVDAVFGYIYGTRTFSPTFEQLKVESTYNTYLNPGLPPGAIANPGLDALRAALTPKESPYYFYLTGADGTMHYATTFEAHVANRRFLR